MNKIQNRFLDKCAKFILVLATACSPYYFLFPTSISLYEILVVISIILIVLSRGIINLPTFHYLLPILLLFLGYLISLPNSIDNTSMNAILQLPLFTIQAVAVYSMVENKADLWHHCMAISTSIIVLTCTYLLLLFGITTHIEYIGQVDNAYRLQDRLNLLYHSPNRLALILLMIIPSSIAVLAKFKRYLAVKTVYSFCITIAFVMILDTGSRSALITILFVIIFVSVIKLISNLEKYIFINKVIILSIMLAASVVYLFINLRSWLPNRVVETLDGDRDIDRIELWIDGLVEYLKSPFLGSGYNQVSYQMTNPHHIIITPLNEGGILAGVGVFYLIIFNLRSVVTGLRSNLIILPGFAFTISTFNYFVMGQFQHLYMLSFVWLNIALSFRYFDLLQKSALSS